jgi:GxxExxY protein
VADIIYKEESYNIIGACIEVYNTLGKGFSEIVYKDALEYEFKKRSIPYRRERGYDIPYKDTILEHKYFADFVVYDKITLEVKSATSIVDGFVKQTLNYITIAHHKLGLIINFGEDSLVYKRILL